MYTIAHKTLGLPYSFYYSFFVLSLHSLLMLENNYDEQNNTVGMKSKVQRGRMC